MAKFSRQISDFLKNSDLDPELNVAIVPKSESCAVPGDVLFFRYSLKNRRRERLFMVTQPITRMPGTGNLLLTGFVLPNTQELTIESLAQLYNTKGLEKDNYRTYIMSKIFGPLRRVRVNPK